jgi:hypothetical protein
MNSLVPVEQKQQPSRAAERQKTQSTAGTPRGCQGEDIEEKRLFQISKRD